MGTAGAGRGGGQLSSQDGEESTKLYKWQEGTQGTKWARAYRGRGEEGCTAGGRPPCILRGRDRGGSRGVTSEPSSLTRRGTAQASRMAVLLVSLFMASALKASAAAAVTPSNGVASRSFTRAGMPYCSLQDRKIKFTQLEVMMFGEL